MVDFPNVRAPLREGWDGGAPNGVRVTPMDAGPAKRRIESTAEGVVESFRFKWSDADFGTFDAFYATNKAVRFNLDHWIWGAVEACFSDAPRYSGATGPFTLANVRLEIYR